jgi:hypothetical protein
MANARKESKKKSNRKNVVKNLKRIEQNNKVLKMIIDNLKNENSN